MIGHALCTNQISFLLDKIVSNSSRLPASATWKTLQGWMCGSFQSRSGSEKCFFFRSDKTKQATTSGPRPQVLISCISFLWMSQLNHCQRSKAISRKREMLRVNVFLFFFKDLNYFFGTYFKNMTQLRVFILPSVLKGGPTEGEHQWPLVAWRWHSQLTLKANEL